jgi:1-phosphofructokinase family hexose kinase
MIVTITLNPSIDRTIKVEDLRRGGVNRAELIRLDAAGKGVNVSRALAAYGIDTHAVMVGAGLGSEWMSEQLSAQDIAHTMVMAQGITRSNLTLVEADGTVTKINEPGVTMTPEILAAVEGALDSLPLENNWVVLAGRLNPGAADDTYSRLVQHAKARGASVVLDASGAALSAAVHAGGPDLIKPNQHELGGLVGREPQTVGDAVESAREVIARGIGSVLCSLGKDGALYVTADDVVHVEPAHAVVGTPVGAGDILLATFLAGGAQVSALPGAVQWSAASVALPGTAIPTPEQAAAVEVLVHSDVDLNRQLAEVD